MTTPAKTVPSRIDKATLQFTIVLGGIAAALTLVSATLRVIEVAANRDVPVTAAFADTPASLPIGPDGTLADVVVLQAVFRVSGMPPATMAALLLAEIVSAITIIAVIVCVLLLCRQLIRGRAFDRRSVRIVAVGSFFTLGGWVLTWLFETIAANGGSAALAEGASQNTPLQPDVITPFGLVALGALAVAFQIGHKLDRDNRGLV